MRHLPCVRARERCGVQLLPQVTLTWVNPANHPCISPRLPGAPLQSLPQVTLYESSLVLGSNEGCRAQSARMQRCHASRRAASTPIASWHEAAADRARLFSIQVACARAAAQESCLRARAGGTPACATRATSASARPPGGVSPSAIPWRSWRSCMPLCAAASLRVRYAYTQLSQPSAFRPMIRPPFAPLPPSPLMIIMPGGAEGRSAASSAQASAGACRLCGRHGQEGSPAGGCHAGSGTCRHARAAAPAGGEAGGSSSLCAAWPQLQPQVQEAQKGEVSQCVCHTCT